MSRMSKRGFTTIELLTVAAVIGVLASVILVSTQSARQQGRDSQRKADIAEVTLAQEQYYLLGTGYLATSDWPDAIPPLMQETPRDPGNLSYTWVDNSSNPSRFCVYAQLENKGHCATTRYFVGSEAGHGERCDTIPSLGDCGTTVVAGPTPNTLKVNSFPITGVSIWGDFPGTTNYTVTQSDDINATIYPLSDPPGYTFSSWSGCDTALSRLCIVKLFGGATRTVIANYHL